jgi:hypothetical protein
VAASARSRGARNAGLYLAELLLKEYRHLWDRPDYVQRSRSNDLHYAAVANILAERLQLHPREGRPGDRDAEPRQYLPLVSRALRGERLSRQTLEVFIAAFAMAPEHADELRRQWDGTVPARVVIGSLPPLGGGPSQAHPRYKTISMHEFHYVGEDGQPTHHRSIRDIESLVDGLDTFRYSFDTDRVSVERIHGGVPGEPYHIAANTWAVDIRLPRRLAHGQSHTLEFATRFRNPEFGDTCLRRVAHERYENVTLWVEFDKRKIPGAVWWAQWQDYRAPDITVIDKEPFELDSDNTVSHRLAVLDHAVVGFLWEW